MAYKIKHRVYVRNKLLGRVSDIQVVKDPYTLISTCQIVCAAQTFAQAIDLPNEIKRTDNIEIEVGYDGGPLSCIFVGCVSEVGIGKSLIIYGEDNMFIAKIREAIDVSYSTVGAKTDEEKDSLLSQILEANDKRRNNIGIIQKLWRDGKDGLTPDESMALGESYIDVLLKIPKDKRAGELAKIRAQASNYDVNANEVAVDLERSEGSTTFRSLMRNLVGQMNAVPRSLRVRREAGENVGNLYPKLTKHTPVSYTHLTLPTKA